MRPLWCRLLGWLGWHERDYAAPLHHFLDPDRSEWVCVARCRRCGRHYRSHRRGL